MTPLVTVKVDELDPTMQAMTTHTKRGAILIHELLVERPSGAIVLVLAAILLSVSCVLYT